MTISQTSINVNSAAWRLDQASRPATLTLPQQIALARDTAAALLAAGDGQRAAAYKARELELRAAWLGLRGIGSEQ